MTVKRIIIYLVLLASLTMWNALSEDIRNMSSSASFVSKLKANFIDEYLGS